jgi:DNA polymerase-4
VRLLGVGVRFVEDEDGVGGQEAQMPLFDALPDEACGGP